MVADRREGSLLLTILPVGPGVTAPLRVMLGAARGLSAGHHGGLNSSAGGKVNGKASRKHFVSFGEQRQQMRIVLKSQRE